MSEQIPKLRVLSQCISPASKTIGHHRHREPELLLVTSGELRTLLSNRELVLHEGEGLFINSGATHGVVANSKEGANFICVSFSTDCIAGADDARMIARYIDPILKARNFEYIPLRGSGWANDICDIMRISRGECCRIFKRLYGTTPFQYLVHYRLTRSVYYLSETDKSISQIAQSVGFCSSSYYTKCFRSEYNCTPLKFRQAQHRLAEI